MIIRAVESTCYIIHRVCSRPYHYHIIILLTRTKFILWSKSSNNPFNYVYL